MLTRLSINNYALISSLEMHPHSEMNIITGETGAGKSIMLGAVSLLLGKRADTKVLYNQEKKCIIEGEFNIKNYNLKAIFERNDLDFDSDTIIRREISPNGKSRAFINDSPVTLDILKDLGSRLMDVHSQNQTLLLGVADYQLSLIDYYANTEKTLAYYKSNYNGFISAEKNLKQLLGNAERIAQESDYNNFLLEELVEAGLDSNEQATLEEELKLLEHADEIKGNLNQILAILDQNEQSGTTILQEAKTLINQIGDYTEALKKIGARLDEAYIEISDLVQEIDHQQQLVEVNFNKTEEVRDRLSMIYHLQNKHHVQDIEGLLSIQKKLENETFLASNLEEKIELAKVELEKNKKLMLSSAEELSQCRKTVFTTFTDEITGLLIQLGMPEAKLHIACDKKEPSANGIDQISITFSANKGLAPSPLVKVASGGEFSRLMFCFKYVMADKTSLPTMVFDEIDSGISGEIALKMGDMMETMAKNHQVITISHLPQIAARGQAHYYVYKEIVNDRSASLIKKLSTDDRIEEIAKMIGGDNPTTSAFESAKELIA